MRFWDSSALVPLLVEEETTSDIQELYLTEEGVLVWWGTEVECASAVARLEREGQLSNQRAEEGFSRLRGLAPSWHVVDPLGALRATVIRLLRVHALRAADALQLAAAFAAAEGRPSTLEVVCLDSRLNLAARREGFQVLDREQIQGG